VTRNTIYFFVVQRPPVVGILTRHDFMPQYIRGLYPNVLPR
jgi:chloride channel 7